MTQCEDWLEGWIRTREEVHVSFSLACFFPPWCFLFNRFLTSFYSPNIFTKPFWGQDSVHWLLIKKIWFIYQIISDQMILLFFPLSFSSIFFLKLVRNNHFSWKPFSIKVHPKKAQSNVLNLSNTEFRILFYFIFIFSWLSLFFFLPPYFRAWSVYPILENVNIFCFVL